MTTHPEHHLSRSHPFDKHLQVGNTAIIIAIGSPDLSMFMVCLALSNISRALASPSYYSTRNSTGISPERVQGPIVIRTVMRGHCAELDSQKLSA